MLRRVFILGALWLTAGLAPALAPHEVALLVNSSSADSREIANAYIRLRQIPAENVLYVDLPPVLLTNAWEIAAADFEKFILRPAQQAIRSRGIGGHIRAWVYSAGFPPRVVSPVSGPLSLTGATLLGGDWPARSRVQEGAWRSPFFRGPEYERGQVRIESPQSADDVYPVPSESNAMPAMMLGVAASNGSTCAQIRRCLENGRLADGTRPAGVIYFVRTGDRDRSGPREWQYEGARKLLAGLGVQARVVDRFPEKAADILGVMTGAADVDPAAMGVFRPGAMAEHLTSFAGAIDVGAQTKLTAWLNAGATASAGAVTEPLNNWMKFPSAFFFYYYAQGCTALESFHQSTRCPLQILFVGDPLAAPWLETAAFSLVTLEAAGVAGEMPFVADLADDARLTRDVRYDFYLDGRPWALDQSDRMLSVDTRKMSDGWHEMLAVARWANGNMRRQVEARAGFDVANQGRKVELAKIQKAYWLQPKLRAPVQVYASGRPAQIGLLCQGAEVATSPGAEGVLPFEVSSAGPGWVAVQGFARYADGSQVRSAPFWLEIKRQPEAGK